MTRDNARAIAEVVARCKTRNGCPQRIAGIEQDIALLEMRVAAVVKAEEESVKRNDRAHDRIEKAMENARKERIKQMDDLKADLIREIRRNGNGNGNVAGRRGEK